jgi:hypothetical protein
LYVEDLKRGSNPAKGGRPKDIFEMSSNLDYGILDTLKAIRPMRLTYRLKIIGFGFIIFVLGCANSQNLPTPEKIGEKERVRVITGKQAAQVVDKMHGRSVATHANVIAEYGRDPKDLLFISRYGDHTQAQKAFDLMIEKMAAAKKSPFFHLMPLDQYDNKVYITLGMGAMHYIYVSGNCLLWLQTYQSFRNKLPGGLLKLYPFEQG